MNIIDAMSTAQYKSLGAVSRQRIMSLFPIENLLLPVMYNFYVSITLEISFKILYHKIVLNVRTNLVT